MSLIVSIQHYLVSQFRHLDYLSTSDLINVGLFVTQLITILLVWRTLKATKDNAIAAKVAAEATQRSAEITLASVIDQRIPHLSLSVVEKDRSQIMIANQGSSIIYALSLTIDALDIKFEIKIGDLFPNKQIKLDLGYLIMIEFNKRLQDEHIRYFLDFEVKRHDRSGDIEETTGFKGVMECTYKWDKVTHTEELSEHWVFHARKQSKCEIAFYQYDNTDMTKAVDVMAEPIHYLIES